MKNPLLFLAINDYISKVITNSFIKKVQVKTEDPDKGFIYYDVANSTYKIPPIDNAQEVIDNTVAGLLISEGYVIVNALDNTFVVSNKAGDKYFITGNQCSCPDRFSPCKHILFSRWYINFRKNQVKLLHMTRD